MLTHQPNCQAEKLQQQINKRRRLTRYTPTARARKITREYQIPKATIACCKQNGSHKHTKNTQLRDSERDSANIKDEYSHQK